MRHLTEEQEDTVRAWYYGGAGFSPDTDLISAEELDEMVATDLATRTDEEIAASIVERWKLDKATWRLVESAAQFRADHAAGAFDRKPSKSSPFSLA